MTISGIFVQPTQNFQANEEELRLILARQTQLFSTAINSKESGIFTVNEISTNQLYYFNSNPQIPFSVIRKVFSIPPVASGATVTFNNDVSGISFFVDYYGCCKTDVPDFRHLPYPSVTANANIEVTLTLTQIIIANGAASPNITSGTLVLEYIKT